MTQRYYAGTRGRPNIAETSNYEDLYLGVADRSGGWRDRLVSNCYRFLPGASLMPPACVEPAPVILVGLPRSGSTLLSRILNDCPDHYVLNDLYILQVVDAEQGWDGLSPSGSQKVIDHLKAVIELRSGPVGGLSVSNSAPMPPAAYERCVAYLCSGRWSHSKWPDLIANAIGYAANCAGKSRWGYNTPQDYLHLDKVFTAWPNAQVIFLMRDPRDVLKSYKYNPKEDYAERFHPAAQSLSWRSAARAYRKGKQRWPDQVTLLHYRDLLNHTTAAIERINAAVGTRIPTDISLGRYDNNSSYRKTQRTEARLTAGEQWLSDKILLSERRELGYDYPLARLHYSDWLPLVRTTWVFLSHYLPKLFTDSNMRTRVRRLLQSA